MSHALDQWTPATVAAAQANRPRRYGASNSSVPGTLNAEVLGRFYWAMGQFSGEGPMSLILPHDPNYASRYYATERADWSSSDHWSRFGNVVQTFRQAVARIVRRAKWRRIIRALKLRARDGHGLHTRTVLYEGRPGPSMWPRVRQISQSTDAQMQAYAQRMGLPANWRPGLRGTGTQGFN